MKKPFPTFAGLMPWVVALLLGAGAAAQPSAPVANPRSALTSTATGPGSRSIADLLGRSVVSADGQRLGEVRDLVIDAQNGRVVFAVISSGGALGIGGNLRAVPYVALQWSTAPGDVRLNLDRRTIENQPDFRGEQLATLAGQERQMLRQIKSTSPSAVVTAPSSGRLVLASNLDGRELRGVNQVIGEIDGVLFNPDRQSASLLVMVDETVVEGGNRYVVGFNQVSLGSAAEGPIPTRLAAADFQGPATLRSTPELSSGRPYAWRDASESEAAEPADAAPRGGAGRHSDAPATGAADDPTVAVVAAVRASLAHDGELRAAARRVEVLTDGPTIVLRGSVPTAAVRMRLLAAARSAAQGRRVEDQLTLAGAAE